VEQVRSDSGISVAELLAAFSLATDLGLGQPLEHVLRAWRMSARLGQRIELPVEDEPDLFYVAMLAWVGCVADAPEVSALFGDDIVFRSDSYQVDLAGLPGLGFFLGHAGNGGSPARRLRSAATLVAGGPRRLAQGMQSHCLTTSTLADSLGLRPEISVALRQFFSRWDGQGVPPGVGGSDIALPVRLFHIADVVEVHHRVGGREAAVQVARSRRGSQFDPALVDAFCAAVDDIVGDAESIDVHEMLAGHPALTRGLTEDALDDALVALADFTDLRSPDRAGHSRAVADLSAAAATTIGLGADDATLVRRAALVHDIGLHGVPSTVLDKRGQLTGAEIERLRAGSYFTERVLARPVALARIGAVASTAHERMDGSGYHRGLTGPGTPKVARVLAAACAYRTLTEQRGDRPPLTTTQAATSVRADARAGLLDPEVVEAVLAASGAGGRRRVVGPAGLTPREIEVLVLIARGMTTKTVARMLSITPKTAGTHIERIYTKTGASSRSTATLFALRHGLLDPLEM
jgi:HD-GYP domain-containing protein (c-di-GMP phosphodiesterase class II)/DNA-binding CsgD family transcriptional regulator